MARDFIKIDLTSASATQAANLRNAILTLRNAQDAFQRILDVMSHNNDGSNFADIEALFGLPVGKGQVVFDLVNGTVGSMKGTFQVADATTITQQVG